MSKPTTVSLFVTLYSSKISVKIVSDDGNASVEVSKNEVFFVVEAVVVVSGFVVVLDACVEVKEDVDVELNAVENIEVEVEVELNSVEIDVESNTVEVWFGVILSLMPSDEIISVCRVERDFTEMLALLTNVIGTDVKFDVAVTLSVPVTQMVDELKGSDSIVVLYVNE